VRGNVRRRLKERMLGRVDVNIGKQGLTESVLKEIDRRLSSDEMVKVRILKSALAVEGIDDRKKFADILAQKLGASTIEVRGYTVVLYRRRKKRTV
jgi:RNA-binding protein